MSVVSIAAVKRFLRVTHTADDELIVQLTDGAEDEIKQYLDRNELPRRDDPCADCESDSTLNTASDSDDIAPTVRDAICLLVQALYEGADADEMEKVRQVAFAKARPYRCRIGV